jgi:hypothetical protein
MKKRGIEGGNVEGKQQGRKYIVEITENKAMG